MGIPPHVEGGRSPTSAKAPLANPPSKVRETHDNKDGDEKYHGMKYRGSNDRGTKQLLQRPNMDEGDVYHVDSSRTSFWSGMKNFCKQRQRSGYDGYATDSGKKYREARDDKAGMTEDLVPVDSLDPDFQVFVREVLAKEEALQRKLRTDEIGDIMQALDDPVALRIARRRQSRREWDALTSW